MIQTDEALRLENPANVTHVTVQRMQGRDELISCEVSLGCLLVLRALTATDLPR